jgi:tetratricopeptide (TPR) repeat protein
MNRSSLLYLICIAVSLAALVVGCSGNGRVTLAQQYIHAGKTYLADGKLDKALAEFEKARETAPHHLPIYLQIGRVYTLQGRFGKAVESCRYVLEQDPESARAYALWGSILLRRGRFAEAVPKYEKAAELDPSDIGVLSQWGLALVKLGRNEEALPVFERAAQVDPSPSADFLAHWGTALQHLGRREEAIRKYEAALDLVPEHFTSLNNLGLLFVRRESDRARGIRLLENAVKARPGDPSTVHNLGWAYLQAKRYPEAYNLLQRAVAATDSSSPAYAERLANLRRAEAQLPRRAATSDMPNILFFVIDTLRADHLSSYGYPRKTTPHIDAVAKRGALFENAISQAPWTAASMASLFTGLYPSVHGLDGGIRWGPGQRSAGGALPFAVQKVLSSSQVTLAEGLRRHGYRTAGFVSNIYVNSIFGFSQGFETYNDEHRSYSKNVARVKRRAKDTNKYVFEWLDKGPERGRDAGEADHELE